MAAAVALLCHALLLFGFRLETGAVPLPAAETAVDVDLVAAAAAPAPVPAPVAPEPPPPPPEATPPPNLPPPPSEPAPKPESNLIPEPKPESREITPHHEVTKSARQNVAAPKAPVAAPAMRGSTANTGAPGGVNSPVRPRSNPKPSYPPEARRLGQQGRVILEVQVGADGRVLSVNVKRSSGFPALDGAAVQTVQRWTFEPARVAGVPVVSRADVPVNFSMAQ